MFYQSYGTECRPVDKETEQIRLAGIRMLRRMSGVTREDRIRNELKSVVSIVDNSRENRQRWFWTCDEQITSQSSFTN